MSAFEAKNGEPVAREGAPSVPAPMVRSPQLLILSSETESGLDRATHALREFLESNESVSLDDAAYSLQVQSRALPYRRAFVCADRQDALRVLGEQGSKRIFSARIDGSPRPVVFLLPGVGDQYVGMGHELYLNWEVFRAEVDRCSNIINQYIGLDIREVLYPASQSWKKAAVAKGIDLRKMLARTADSAEDPDSSRLNRTRFAQPALFTVEYATARLWQSLGINPDLIVGHSMGEYVAACLAGVFSLEDALRLIAVRAALVDDLPQGAMLSVLLSEVELLPLVGSELSISLVNGPNNCVVAGTATAIDEFEKLLAARDVISRRVQNGHAFHTKVLIPILDEFRAEAAKVRFNVPSIPYSSNVTGTWVKVAEATDPAYWAKHAIQTARFSDTLSCMWQLGNPVLVECGPGRTLGALAAQHPLRKVNRLGAISSLRHHYENEADDDVLLRAIGRLWLTGASIDWKRIQRGGESRLIPLPSCLFEDEPQAGAEKRDGLVGATQDVETPSRKESGGDGAASQSAPVGTLSSGSYVAPRTDLEVSLAKVCEKVLGIERVGVTDNFFELGGHSLAVIKLIVEMKRVTGLEIDLGEVFRTPTIGELALNLGADVKKKASFVVPLQPKGPAIPIFCICGIDIYREFAQSLGEDQPVWGVYIAEERAIMNEVLDGKTSGISIDRLVDAYDSAITRFRPQGPYRLAGLSFGGMLAVELASKMRKRGEIVDFVFLLDTLLPEGARRRWGSWLLRQLKEIMGAQRARKFRQIYAKLRTYLSRRAADGTAASGTEAFYQEFAGRQRAAFFEAEKTWQVRSEVDFPVILFRASDHDMWGRDLEFAEDYGWRRYVGDRLQIVRVTGGHRSIIEEPNVGEVGRLVRQYLAPAAGRE
jgi:malonyl CoA-acyl carrier protein transacylase/thioesterase domain-containing protein/aryl carrier-like protein